MRRSIALLVVVLCLVVTAGVVMATIPDADGLIHACYVPGGLLRVVDGPATSCRPGEASLDWNQQGPPGAPGAAATKLFALYDASGSSGPGGIPAGVRQQSGGISVSSLHPDDPLVGFDSYVVTFPRDLSQCVAQASIANKNGSFVLPGNEIIPVLGTSISGTHVTVYWAAAPESSPPSFAITAFC